MLDTLTTWAGAVTKGAKVCLVGEDHVRTFRVGGFSRFSMSLHNGNVNMYLSR